MAWTWSHSAEAYAVARHNLGNLSRETLCEILAEWNATDTCDDGYGVSASDMDVERFEREQATLVASPLGPDDLADAIWDLASEQATCDNGGFEAWMCPHGCGCHTVSFSPATSAIYPCATVAEARRVVHSTLFQSCGGR